MNLYPHTLALLTIAGTSLATFGQVNSSGKSLGLTRAHNGPVQQERWHQDADAAGMARGGGAPNALCANAQVLTVNAPGACPGAAVAGDNAGAGHDGADPACDSTTDAFEDVWYSFNAGAFTSVTIDIAQGDIEDVIVEVIATDCTGSTVFCNFTQLSYSVPVTPGADYIIRIASNLQFGSGGSFTICLTGQGGGPTPPNDDCDGAVAQPLGAGQTVVFSGNNTGATVDVADFIIVWESFTTTECTNVTIDYCVPGFVYENFLINLITTCPDILTGLLTGTFDDCTVSFLALPAGTYWIPVLVDAGNTPIGDYSVAATAVACPSGYCQAGATSVQFEKIGNVTFANINNTSTSTAGYEDFTAITANVQQGQTYPITVTISNPYDEDIVYVWIDFDQNEVFDANELVYESPMGQGPHTGPVSIPAGATLGTTRMRIRLHDSTLGPNDTPCGNSTYGQVEDYSVNIASAGGGGSPENDDCANATVLTVFPPGGCPSGETAGDNSEATQDGGEPDCDSTTSIFQDVWYTFNSGSSVEVTVFTTPGTMEDLVVEIYEGISCSGPTLFCEFGPAAFQATIPVTPDTDYTVRVSSNTQFGAGGTFTICVTGTTSASYCNAGATSTLFEKISNVTFANIDNTSTGTAGYEDFTGITGDVSRGEAYTITVTISDPYDEDMVLVWIDYDQNIVFDDNELVYESDMGQGPHSGTITIPFNAALGNTRMRIRLHDSSLGSNDTPCGNSTYGQVEDYTLNIDIGSGLGAASGTQWAMFPNPTDGALNIVGGNGTTVLEVLDLTGRLLHAEQRVFTSGQPEHLPLAGRLAAGTYVLRMVTGEGQRELRFVVR